MGSRIVRSTAGLSAVVVLLSGCAATGEFLSLPPSPCPESADGEAVSPTRSTFVSPHYDGPGPHLLSIHEVESHPFTETGSTVELPPEWLAPQTGNAKEFEAAQLAVCRYVTPGTEITFCGYFRSRIQPRFTDPDRRISVVEATYTFVVLEARTGDRIGAFELPGVEEEGWACPEEYVIDGKYPDLIVHDVSEEALRDGLRPFVEDTV